MSNQYTKDDRKGNLPQYGKKGHKPRTPYSRREISLDEIHTNDISYWNKTSGYANVTKFTWDLMVGNPRNAESIFTNTMFDRETTGDINPPQIMSLDVAMGPGWAEEVNDGVNRSLAMLMAKIRSNLSTSNIGFETSDLGIFFASTSSIAALIGYAKRVLECYNMWEDRNYVYPRALIEAQGFNYNDIRDNINAYTATLNSAIDMYNNMSIIDCFDIYDRQYSMMHNVFADEDSELAQLYLFRPMNYYKYMDAGTTEYQYNFAKSYIVPYSTFSKFSQFITLIDGAIQAWYGSSDLYQINGVLLRAFKEAPRQNIPRHDILNRISPTVDRAFLMQIMNCTITPVESSSLDIIQDPTTQNYVIWKPELDDLRDRDDYGCLNVILRLFENDVSHEDNMELTRLTNFVHVAGFDTDKYLKKCGSEIVSNITISKYDSITNSSVKTVIDLNTIDLTTPTSFDVAKIMSIMPFRYIPVIHVIYDAGEPIGTRYMGFLGDVYNWMLYSRSDWELLQFVAYQSLWIPKNI